MAEERSDSGLAPKRLAALYRISRTLLSSIKLDRLLSLVIDVVAENLGADTVSIMFLDKEGGELTIKAAKGIDERIARDTCIRIGEGIAGVIAREKKAYLLIDGRLPPEFKGIRRRKEVGSCLCAPIILLDEVIGVISVVRMKSDKKNFTKNDLQVLWLFAGEAAKAITNARFYEEMEKRVEEKTIELEQANVRLKELDRLKSAFLATVSHELRTPLTSLKSYAEILLSQEVDKETTVEFLGIIDREVKRLSRLVDNLLDISTIEAGRFGLNLGKINIKRVIDDSISALQPKALEKGIKISSETKDLPRVLADSERLFQVMENLLDNAVKFTHRAGQVRIKAYEEDGSIKVSLSDTGVGIKVQDLERIFDRFYQSGTEKERSKGIGLGLPICKEIITRHKGRIWVESEIGKGSTFYFTIPMGEQKTNDR